MRPQNQQAELGLILVCPKILSAGAGSGFPGPARWRRSGVAFAEAGLSASPLLSVRPLWHETTTRRKRRRICLCRL
jgi:hypothetical protein